MSNTIPEISIIIPTLNEEEHIGRLIGHLSDTKHAVEFIVADANSKDATPTIAAKEGAQIVKINSPSRPKQLNAGAARAKANILYFVHADTLPPKDYAEQILTACQDSNVFGSFRFKFNSNRAALRFNSWCTRFPVMMFRGGDQSLFMKRDLFDELNGFREDYTVMEDYDILRRGKKIARFKLLQDDVVVSARKYDENPYWKVNLSNFVIFSLYYLGVHPEKLIRLYEKMIRHPKPTTSNTET